LHHAESHYIIKPPETLTGAIV